MLFISMTLLRAMNASGAGRDDWAPMNIALTCTAVATAVCVCSRMRVRAYVGMCACVMCLQYTIIKFDPG